jgi:hypothetical protein
MGFPEKKCLKALKNTVNYFSLTKNRIITLKEQLNGYLITWKIQIAMKK